MVLTQPVLLNLLPLLSPYFQLRFNEELFIRSLPLSAPESCYVVFLAWNCRLRAGKHRDGSDELCRWKYVMASDTSITEGPTGKAELPHHTAWPSHTWTHRACALEGQLGLGRKGLTWHFTCEVHSFCFPHGVSAISVVPPKRHPW